MAGSFGIACVSALSAWMVCGVASCGLCRPDFSHFWQIDLESIQQDKAGVIVSFEEKSGEILVSIADRVGDCHIFRLNHPGKSTKETLEILKTKQEEQKKAKTSQGSQTVGASGAPRSER